MADMVTSGDYLITYDKQHNRLIVTMPQTMGTVTNTAGPVVNRKSDFTESDLAAILAFVQLVLKYGDK